MMIVYDKLTISGETEKAEGIIVTTHGLEVDYARVVSTAEPKIDILALLHTTRGRLEDMRANQFYAHRSNITNTTADAWTPPPFIHSNLGAPNGLQTFREVNAKYWIASHDELQRSTGPLHWFFTEIKVMPKEAVEVAWKDENPGLEKPSFVEVEKGETFLVV